MNLVNYDWYESLCFWKSSLSLRRPYTVYYYDQNLEIYCMSQFLRLGFIIFFLFVELLLTDTG